MARRNRAPADADAAPRTPEVAAVEKFLRDLSEIRTSGAGVPETSYYPALAALFSAIGKTLKPRVRCILQLAERGAGMPDGGLFTADQFQRQAHLTPREGQLPSRGALEVKSPAEHVRTTMRSAQVRKYLPKYGIVLVTNLREFLIVERGDNDRPRERESFALAENERDFWQHVVAHPRASATRFGPEFGEFLKRACLHAAPLSDPQELASFLASYARTALFRVEARKDLPALAAVRAALEEALGMEFQGEEGEHFFRSTLVQTLFYGVFSAWVLWHRANPGRATFDWRNAAWTLHVPFIRTLYEEVAKPTRLGPLALVETLDWAAAALNRVVRAAFFKRFREEHAVQYFYEPFLEAYDPALRKSLGVWYTPPEIVKYQVARVDTVLREELDIPDGLADPNVVVLDPCCGTGAYLVEVLAKIAETLRARGGDALVGADLKRAAMERVFGFEILAAPFVVAHLQLGMALQRHGAALVPDSNERVAVYLTNALTGWEPPSREGKQRLLAYPELAEERDAAERVKREQRILVVLGNPPYNAFAGVSPVQEERDLVAPYKEKLNAPVAQGGWGIKKFNLDDLYVRFFRLAERRIAELTGRGVVSFISNFSYLGDPSFVVMREQFLSEFDALWFDCLNGDSRETGKLTPAGEPDPSVFSTEHNKAGIRVGTAVSVIVRKPERAKKPVVRFRHFWGANKRAELLGSLGRKNFNRAYARTRPDRENRHSFRPETVSADYRAWPRLTDLCAVPPSNGLMEKRGGALFDIDREALEARMRDYFAPDLSWSEYKALGHGPTAKRKAFDPKASRRKAIAAESFAAERIVRYALRPFETRWCYYSAVPSVWNRARPALWAQCWRGNAFLMARPAGVADPEGVPLSFTRCLGDNDYQKGHSYFFPVRVKDSERLDKKTEATLFDAVGGAPSKGSTAVANLSKAAREYLRALRLPNPDADAEAAGLLWMHALAIGYSPAYLDENADGIRRDWPRIPLPRTRRRLEASAALGARLAALLDTEAEVKGVTTGRLGPLFKTLGVVSKVGKGSLDPAKGDLAMTVGWGHAGRDNAVMPGKGRVEERAYTKDELAALAATAKASGLSAAEARRRLGAGTCDVYLNGAAYWKNVPKGVWEFRIGGYQVVKKWLSYREQALLGRPLTLEEAREVSAMVRRLAAIALLQPALDDNYKKTTAATYVWPTTS